MPDPVPMSMSMFVLPLVTRPRAPHSVLPDCAEGALPLLACEGSMNLVDREKIRKGRHKSLTWHGRNALEARG